MSGEWFNLRMAAVTPALCFLILLRDSSAVCEVPVELLHPG